MAKPREPIAREFRIFVVPEGDVEVGFSLLPPTIRAARPSPFDSARDEIRFVADWAPHSKGACFWAMGPHRKQIVANLRNLADYLEKYGKDFDALTERKKS